MFLALKELRYTKRKFVLIIAVIVLISYLVYFLTSLAYGLASSYTNGIYKIEANYVILDENANDNMMMSMLKPDDFESVKAASKAKLSIFPAVILNKDADLVSDTKVEVYLFGIEDIQFFLPNTTYDRLLDGEVIVDDSIKKLGYEIGDTIGMPGYETEWVIAGFTSKATYQTAPIVYMKMTEFNEHRFGENINQDVFNAVVVKGNYTLETESLQAYTLAAYVKTLPGYQAQVLTFSMMIIFLILIVSVVLGIFIYVLTLQKTSMFGVMKAQGISNRYIGISVLSQSLVMLAIGIVFGFFLTQATGYFLKDVIPFASNYLFYSIITLAFFLFTSLGALFSVSTVVNIDPLKAIG